MPSLRGYVASSVPLHLRPVAMAEVARSAQEVAGSDHAKNLSAGGGRWEGTAGDCLKGPRPTKPRWDATDARWDSWESPRTKARCVRAKRRLRHCSELAPAPSPGGEKRDAFGYKQLPALTYEVMKHVACSDQCDHEAYVARAGPWAACRFRLALTLGL